MRLFGKAAINAPSVFRGSFYVPLPSIPPARQSAANQPQDKRVEVLGTFGSLPQMEMTRITLGKMQNPVRGFLHGTAAVAAIFATIFLAVVAQSWGIRIGAVVFGVAMVALYTTSSLYHAIPWAEQWKKRMQRIDHSMILVLIAGTYTPVAIVALEGSLRLTVLIVAWTLVAVGAIQHTFFPQDKQTFSMILAISMGWLGVAIAWRFVPALGWIGAGLALAGGLVYSVGMLGLITNRPRLWPRVFSYHEVFHIMVITASVIHFVMIWRYVLPSAS